MIQFINQDPKNRFLSASDRRIVRKVSNTAAAATRKAKATNVRVNTLQLPDFLISEMENGSDSETRATQNGPPRQKSAATASSRRRVSALGLLQQHMAPLRPPLSLWPDNQNSPEYISLLMQPGLSTKLLVDASSMDVNSDPRRWVKICRLTSILQFLPRLMGHSKCLDYAIDCLAERVRQVCVASPDIGYAQTHLEKLYGRALQCLQGSLNSAGSIDWTVWYSTLLLALFELLENSSHHAWILHSAGAKHVLNALGPDNITSEYQKILLAAQCQILTVEATYINQACFLSKAEWQQALQSTITRDILIPERSEAVVSMWSITACAPGLFKRATEAVLQHQPPAKTAQIADELCILLDKYSKWRERWEESLLCEAFPVITDAALARAGPTIYPQYLAFWAMANRFLLAVQPYRAPVAENNAINAALRIIEFDQLREKDAVVDLCRTFSASIARAIKATTMEWTMQQYVARGQTMEPAVFLRWNTLLGRAV